MTRLDPVVYSCVDDTLSLVTLQQIEFFERNGFLLLDSVFSDDEVLHMQQDVSRIKYDPLVCRREETVVDPIDTAMLSVFDIQRFSPLLRAVMHDARLAGMARYLLGEGVYLHQSRLNCNPGFHGRAFYWHSDFETWHVEDGMPRMQALSVSILLSDVYFSNGPTMLIPGSHRHFISCGGLPGQQNAAPPIQPGGQTGVPGDDVIRALVEAGGIALAAGKAGSVLLIDCNILQGATGNMSPYARDDLVFVYNAIGNRLTQPYGERPPRPEYMAHRARIETF